MSRIGKLPVMIPSGVTCTVAPGNMVTVKGPKGQLTEKVHEDMVITQQDGQLTVTRPTDNKIHRAMHGLARTLIHNMVVGVTAGYQKDLELVGTGYRAQKTGNKLVLTVGYSHPVEVIEPEGITLEVTAQNKISIKGISKQQVGAMAANIRAVRQPEPYHGKGIRYDKEVVRLKEGKAGKSGKK